jgi:glycosyltransferase involved in cell wall biosynthesis
MPQQLCERLRTLPTRKPRVAVVSPFLDKRHGTELCIAEQLERLSGDYEFHLYSMRVEDIDLTRIQWHHIPEPCGPLLFQYLWWFIVNQTVRWWQANFSNVRCDLLYSPGVNCLGADIIAVHIVFAEFYRLVKYQMNLKRNPIRFWPRLIHRWIYYHLAIGLERLAYTKRATLLVPVSHKVADDLKRCYGRSEVLPVVYNATNLERFSPQGRAILRSNARRSLRLDEHAFAILLIGNDWMKKGLSCLLAAIERIANPNLRVLIGGHDDTTPYKEMLHRAGLSESVSFLPIRQDVEIYYAAADAYVGPSLEDAFSIPPLEAMACGLPVIVSRQAGVSEIITAGLDGFILEDPQDSVELAKLLRRLYDEPELCRQVGERANETAKQFTWERNAAEIKARLDLAFQLKHVTGNERE